ncbi:MAG: hypothetical protein KAR87_04690 [Candidatus Aenigmarchaeota archaeon]|nr:hypothetical protein [Candidatus Aenigmarchaeota archaeon]
MWSINKLLFAMMTVVFLSPLICFADDFSVDITPSQYSVYPGDIINFNTTVKNILNLTQEFSISITNTNYPNWATIKDYHFTVEPNETKTFVFYISPDKDAQKGTYTFDFDLSYTKEDNRYNINEEVNFFVIQEGLLKLKLDMNKTRLTQGEDTKIVVSVESKGTVDFKNALLVIKLKEKNIILEEEIPLIKKGETKVFEKTFEFDEVEEINKFTITADVYKTYMSGAKNSLVDSKQVEGVIVKKSKINTSYFEKKDDYLIHGEFLAENNGNEDGSTSFSLDILYPVSFYAFSRVPDEITTNRSANKKTATWNCNDIEPNQACNISYDIDLKSMYYIKIFSVFFFIIYVFYIFSHQLSLKKKVLKVSKEKTSITIELKNNVGKALDWCEINEFVPASLKVEGNFDALSPDEIKRTKKGTKLKWVFKPFVRGEERVMVYSVKPMLKTFEGITIPPTEVIAHIKNKKYVEKSKSLNVC